MLNPHHASRAPSAIQTRGDFDEYWQFHEEAEARRNHTSRYADGKVLRVAMPTRKPKLRIVRGVD